MPDFTLTIDLGNDAMRTGQDVAVALHELAERLDGDSWLTLSGVIHDANGNAVGGWRATESA